MIKSFGNKLTEQLWAEGAHKKIAPEIAQRTLDRLQLINAAPNINALRLPPSNQLKQLSGSLKGFWSLRINTQWRLIFKFTAGDAFDVELIDYH